MIEVSQDDLTIKTSELTAEIIFNLGVAKMMPTPETVAIAPIHIQRITAKSLPDGTVLSTEAAKRLHLTVAEFEVLFAQLYDPVKGVLDALIKIGDTLSQSN